jgi:hypothetical protein
MAFSGDIGQLEERLRQAAGVSARVQGELLVLVPANAREAARALAAREQLGLEASRVMVSLEAFDRIDPADPASGTVRAGGRSQVSEIDSALRGWGLTLGGLSPRVRGLTLAQWLEGLDAGQRVVPGGRLETAAMSLTVALRGGGLFSGPPLARGALGPAIDSLILAGGGQVGLLLEATLRAVPRPDVQSTVHASLERPEEVVSLLRAALRADVPVAEAQVQKKSRGYFVDLLLASHAFRARRDRAALEQLVKPSGELRTMRRVYERDFAFEGELAWERLPFAIAQSGPLGLFRLSRESVVVAADEPVKGALCLDATPAPLPPSLLDRLARRRATEGQ